MQTALRRRRVSDRVGCLRRYECAGRPGVRIVCFPWAGAGASAYHTLAAHAPDGIELYAAQYPGREDQFAEAPASSMRGLVARVLDDVCRVCTGDQSLVLFGHSMGALVAYEVAATLEEQGSTGLRMLVASGCGAPGSDTSHTRCPPAATDDDFVENIRELGGTSPQVLEDRGLLRLMVPVLRADYGVLDAYVCGAPKRLSCPIVACAGDRDPSVSPEQLKRWSEFTARSHVMHWFPGDHFYLRDTPSALVDRLWQWSHSLGAI